VKVEYDPEADILYIKIKKGQAAKTIDLGEDVWADIDDNGEIIGIEIWQARKHIITEILKYLRKGPTQKTHNHIKPPGKPRPTDGIRPAAAERLTSALHLVAP